MRDEVRQTLREAQAVLSRMSSEIRHSPDASDAMVEAHRALGCVIEQVAMLENAGVKDWMMQAAMIALRFKLWEYRDVAVTVRQILQASVRRPG